MKKFALLLAVLALTGLSEAALKPGDSLTPYTVRNVATGREYCQVCAYGAKPAKAVAFGKLKDEAFWSDLKRLQALQTAHAELGVFAQVIDSKNVKAIKVAAQQHGITFPIVVAVEKDWDSDYQVKGVSRTIYYAQLKNNIVWTSVGLDDQSVATLELRVKKDADQLAE